MASSCTQSSRSSSPKSRRSGCRGSAGKSWMESLEAAAVDITRLIASSRAVRNVDIASLQGKAGAHHRRLRVELEDATAAYLKTLARAADGVFDDAALMNCRLAAERCMPNAVASVDELVALM